MLLQNSLNLENVIVTLLSQSQTGLTAEEIRNNVALVHKPYSKRGIYKELQRLIAEGVLIRSHSVYSLRLAWIISLQNEIQKITKQIQEPNYLQNALPTKNQPTLLYASNLIDWDRLWTQMMLALHTAFPQLPMFIWCPRHWFTLTHPDMENTFTKANESKKNLRFAIIGGRTALDYKDRAILSRKSTCYSFRLSPFEYDRNHYYWIVGDYFGTSTIDLRTARQIDLLYEQNKKLGSVNSPAIRQLLSQKCRGSIKCEWAPEKTQKMRVKFLKYFDLEIKESGELLTIRSGEIK